MKDENLFRFMELIDAECVAHDNTPRNLFRIGSRMHLKGKDIMKSQKRTDIYLNTLDNETLNDLVIMVKVGKYDEHRKNDPAWIEARKRLSADDQRAWSRQIGAVSLSDEQCIKYLRSWSSHTLADDIRSYLMMEPMTERQRYLLRIVNDARIKTRTQSTTMEVR